MCVCCSIQLLVHAAAAAAAVAAAAAAAAAAASASAGSNVSLQATELLGKEDAREAPGFYEVRWLCVRGCVGCACVGACVRACVRELRVCVLVSMPFIGDCCAAWCPRHHVSNTVRYTTTPSSSRTAQFVASQPRNKFVSCCPANIPHFFSNHPHTHLNTYAYAHARALPVNRTELN